MAQFYFVQHCVRHIDARRTDPSVSWQPAVDIYRCADGWLLKFELAGVRREDIRIEFDRRGIKVSGVRRDVRESGRQETHLMEIAYNRFERLVPLPEPVEDTQLSTEFREGMMYVHVRTCDPNRHE
jgi:HSP20 family protein